ncbi:serine hydrolase domain-containing protein [Pseudochrobactrum kiredjianiae]|uniref:Serine hydrolase domain-containing protein n=1 Tax=Pseudochrobactrum kiredjianiae TaxID=386305 RepID=A0ABW3V3E4_9HYPH|nr:serine hydrolase domain-containing protein [Pseudochrobactrum kiredjianiae]MDM7852534.1 serine hydrolase domain-containing protein [Pseudochrobactrum kiredjianiae]
MNRIADDILVERLITFLREQSAPLQIPGIGLSIVRQGKILYTGGIGVLETGTDRPVTADSLFAIASCSKAFTTTLCAILAEQGKLDWDRPIHEIWPNFAFGSADISKQVTLRDLCSNRTGIGQATALEYGSVLSFDEVVNGAGDVPSIAPFRDRYSYCNLHFTVAAEVCNRSNNMNFAEAIAKYIFAPLQMKTASADRPELESDPRFALPHVRSGDTMRRIGLDNLSNLIGAGSMSQSPNDAAQWLLFNLGALPNSENVLPANKLAELKRIHARTTADNNFLGYGLGWRIGNGNDIRIIDHTGAISGVLSITRLVPDAEFGIFISINASGTEVEDFRNAAVNLAVELAHGDADDAQKLCDQAAETLQEKQSHYRKCIWHGLKTAPVNSVIAGTYDGGPMGTLHVKAGDGQLVTSLDLLPDYQYCLMQADSSGAFPLRSLEAPERWWGIEDKIPMLVLSADSETLEWKNMWFGDCTFHRHSR